MKSPNKLSERNDNVKRIDRSEKVRVHFHQAKWDEPIIYELSTPGERGILVGAPDEEIAGQTKGIDALPEGMKRNTKLNLPELSQSRVLRHTMPGWRSRLWAQMLILRSDRALVRLNTARR